MEGVRGKGSSKVQAGEVTKSKHQGKHRPRSPASEQRNPSSQRNASGAVRRETGTPDHNDQHRGDVAVVTSEGFFLK